MEKTKITATLAAGSTAIPFYYEVEIAHELCCKTCAESAPVFTPAFSAGEIKTVGTDQYLININVQGVVTYNPCGNVCTAKSEAISESFAIPYYATTAPTSVEVTQGATVNAIDTDPCKTCGKALVSTTPLSITIV